MMAAPAIEAIGLTKDFEKGRRTIWQRLRREPDQREALLEWAMLVLTSVGLLLVGRRAWLATEHRLRVQGTLGQH